MTNPLTEFTKNNISEIILGLAIGIIIVLLMNLNFEESITVIILAPLIALVFNKLLESAIPNVKNQRMALVIVGVIGFISLIYYFQLGVFALNNVNSQSFVEIETHSQIAIKTPITITGALIAALGKLPFLIAFTIVIIGLLMSPFAWIGWLILAIIGIPSLIVLGTGVFLIAKNFTLILILIGGYSILSLLFGKKIKEK